MKNRAKRILLGDVKNDPKLTKEFVDNISEALILFSEKISIDLTETTKILSDVLTGYLKVLRDAIPQISDARRKELEKHCDNLLGFGWVVFDYLPIDFYTTPISSKEEADALIDRCCNTEALDAIFETISEFIQREDFDNIKKSYDVKAYRACSAIIIPQIEHYLLLEYKISDNTILKTPAIEKLKKKNENVNPDTFAIYNYLQCYSLINAVKNVFHDYDFRTENDNELSIPNRHFLLHGYSTRNYSQNDCLKLIFVLYGLIKQKDYVVTKLIQTGKSK